MTFPGGSNLITDWREAVVAYLQTVAGDGADVRAGEETSANQRPKDLICVWWPGWTAMPRDLSLANPILMIRYFPNRSRQPRTETPVDESQLEQAAADVMTAMQPMRKAGDFTDGVACYVKSATRRVDMWCVDFELQGYAQNLAASPA